VAKASALEEGSPDIAAPPIGGLDEQLGSIQELLDVALHRPEVVQNKGLRPPVGVLLHGPPGTGKTLIARSLAARSGSDVSFVIINGADVVGKFVGESEGRLRGIFDNAHATPDGKTIIFIDEIDALCPSREGGQSELHNRIVATLLTALDGGARPALLPNTDGSQVTRDGRIFVIAATNRPHALDEALRRPGRLDRELEVGVPSELDRRNILSAVLSAVPHTVTPETLQSIAAKTHGFVGADLALLVKEATMKALRRSRILCTPSAQMGPLPGPGPAAEPEPEPEPHVTSPDLLRPELGPGWALKEADLVESLVLVAPSSLREVALEIPKVNWEDIGGCSTMRQQMREAVEWPLTHPEAFTRMGIRPPRGVLLYGPPGCSKTLTARALATESSLNFIAVKGPELFSKWVGDSEKAVADIYRKARRAAPAIVFFDEIDALAVKRGGAGSVGDRVLSQLLIELDGAAPAHSPQASVVTIAATNRPDLLDPALVRPGRFDRQVYVAPPDSAARLEILRIGTRGVPTADDVDLPAIAAEMEGYSGAEAMAISREASMAALVEAVESAEAAAVGKSTAASVESDAIRITARHFAVARAKVQPSISAEDIAFFEAYAAQQR
jgi:AAA family ATPase